VFVPVPIDLITVLYMCTCRAFPDPPLLLYANNHSSALQLCSESGTAAVRTAIGRPPNLVLPSPIAVYGCAILSADVTVIMGT
jgi:hypothetical protein